MDKSDLNIVLIEDNPADAELINIKLDELMLNYNLRIAATLQAGIEMIEEQSPHVIISDLNLPDSNELDTIVILAERFDLIPIIAMT